MKELYTCSVCSEKVISDDIVAPACHGFTMLKISIPENIDIEFFELLLRCETCIVFIDGKIDARVHVPFDEIKDMPRILGGDMWERSIEPRLMDESLLFDICDILEFVFDQDLRDYEPCFNRHDFTQAFRKKSEFELKGGEPVE